MRIEDILLSMDVCSTGGTITRLQWIESHLFYPEQMILVNGLLKRRGGNPILFPYAGEPPAKISSYRKAPQHGWLRDMNLMLHGSPRVVISKFHLKKKIQYPWDLRCRLIHKILYGYSLKTEIAVWRDKDNITSNAPLNPGFHPYFNNPDGCTIYIGKEKICVNGKGEFPAREFPARDPIKVELESIGTVEMHLAGDYSDKSVIIIWSDRREKYICVEPILGPIDTYLDKEKGVFLKEGESLTMSCTFSFFPC